MHIFPAETPRYYIILLFKLSLNFMKNRHKVSILNWGERDK